MIKYFLTLLFLFIVSLSINAQIFSHSELEIIRLQDERTLGEGNKLLDYLNSRSDEIVIKALIALGNIGDTSAVQTIHTILLSDNRPNIRKHSAYALSLLPCELSRNALLESLNQEKSEEVIPAVLEAFGFIGDKDNLITVSKYLSNDVKIKTAQALSIARFARRGIKDASGTECLKILYQSGNQDVFRMIACAGFYIRNRDLLQPIKEILSSLTKNENYETRMWAFTSFAYTADENDLDYFINSYESEKDWQVKVNILNSYNTIFRFNQKLTNDSKLANFLINKGEGEDVLLSTTALKTLGNIFRNTSNDELRKEIKSRLEWFLIKDKAVDTETIGEAINAYSMIFKDETKNDLIQRYKDSEGYILKPFIISAFKYFDNASVYKDFRDLITNDVQNYVNKNKITDGEFIAGKELNPLYRSFVETLAELKNKANINDKEMMRLIFSEFTNSKDPSIIDICFTALNDSLYLDKRNETAMILNIDYQDLKYPKDKEAMKLFIREMGELKAIGGIELLENNLKKDDYEIAFESSLALKKITGKDYKFNAKRKSFFNADNLNSLEKKRIVELNTTKGKIKIELFPKVAPLTVLNFIRLAEKGFYNNTLFHRVVPNFVIQGGDPLNNGSGGPEYTIRSEFSPMNSERGIFGMASEGKDTEGSQFFIMHSAYYHLDNSYTIFGKVISGMEIVDKIYINDYLIDIKIID